MAILANNPLSAFNAKTLFDIAACTFFKEEDQVCCNQIYYIIFLIAKWIYKSFYGADNLLSILCLHFRNSPRQLVAAFSCCL